MVGNGQQPSTSTRAGSVERLEGARGAVRDTLGAIRNVEQLLKSLRVGPRALAAVIPDAHASCEPLLESFRELLGALDDLGEAPQRIESFITPRVRELEQALADALDAPVNAKQRLALESVVTRIAGELDAARSLVELLEMTRDAPAVPVQLVEVVRDATKVPEGSETTLGQNVPITVEVKAGREVAVNPRLAGRLIRIAVGLVANQLSEEQPHLVVDCPSGGPCGVSVSRGSGSAETLTVPTPRLIECTLIGAQALAHATGGSFEISDDGARVSLSWNV